MKYKTQLIRWAVIVTVVAMAGGCAGSKVLTRSFEADNFIHADRLTHLGEDTNLNDTVLYVNPGDTIPLKISLETDFLAFQQEQVNLVAKQKLYFRIKMPEDLTAEELERLNRLNADRFAQMSAAQRADFLKDFMIYVSRDALHWAPLDGSRGYREVLGFDYGTISLGLTAGTTDGLEGVMAIKALKKTQ